MYIFFQFDIEMLTPILLCEVRKGGYEGVCVDEFTQCYYLRLSNPQKETV